MSIENILIKPRSWTFAPMQAVLITTLIHRVGRLI